MNFYSTNIISYVYAGIIGIILTEIYHRFLSPKIEKFLYYWWPRNFRKKISLAGKWEQTMYIDGENYYDKSTSTIFLKQRRNVITGKFEITNKSGRKLSYFISGKIINNSYIEGEWYNVFSGHNYYGNFLLSIEINMQSFSGFWTGTTSNNKVKNGKWIWHKKDI